MSENGYGFKRSSLKTGVENYTFWSEIGSGFEERGGTRKISSRKFSFHLTLLLLFLEF